MDWYKELLTTSKGETKAELETEVIVNQLWNSIKIIAERQPPIRTTVEEVEEIIKNLDVKKAKDPANWSNKMIKEGGEEMTNSLKKIVNKVDEERVIPDEWQEMDIRVTHKKGDKTLMSNKRGLFLTNNISKVYERVVKERNAVKYREGISEWANGGMKGRGGIDNIMIITSIIEQNKYLKRNTYLTFTDAEKCFDKLWLKDGIYDLWRSGTDVRDCLMIKKLNEKARIVVRTPVGNTEPFCLEDIVRQGTVYGGQICNSSMDKVNKMGKDIITPYAPTLSIRAVTFVDDVNSVGGGVVADNLIHNCSLMEERKKMTFNNKNTKTEYMVIGEFDEEPYSITNTVKKGRVQKVGEHKALGTWFDETGEYGVNIKKKTEKLQYMINTTRHQASPKNIGGYSIDGRLLLAEIVVISSIVYNAEAFPEHKETEMLELERKQHKILTGILELPITTPYYPLLLETGWWTIRGRLAYKKLMLYHNIITSDERRVMKKVLEIQRLCKRSTTWYANIMCEIKTYEIELDARKTLKSRWKKHVKEKINEKMEEDIKERCKNMSKARTILQDPYSRKEYLNVVSLHESKRILKTRLHMNRIPGNYRGKGEGICQLCEEEKGNLEHYFRCKGTRQLVEAWGVNEEDLGSLQKERMLRVANFAVKVEVLLEPIMNGQL